MIYDLDGASLNSVYSKDGAALAQAYDVDGNPLMDNADLVVMTYNVEWFEGINANMAMQSSILDTYEPDIIGWQELQPKYRTALPSALNTLLPDYQHLMGDFGNKNGFSSKIQMSNFTTIPFNTQANMGANWDGQSYCTATINVKGKEIFVVTAHNTTHTLGGEEAVCDQSMEVFEALQGHEYFILLCDLNTICRSTDHWQWSGFMESYYDAGYNIINCVPRDGEFVAIGTYTSSSGNGNWSPNDNIMTSGNIEIIDFVADRTQKVAVGLQTGQKIDHIPIIARLKIN